MFGSLPAPLAVNGSRDENVVDMADDKDVVEKTIAEDLVVTKYKMAGEIVNREFQLMLALIFPYVTHTSPYIARITSKTQPRAIWFSLYAQSSTIPCGRRIFSHIVNM